MPALSCFRRSGLQSSRIAGLGLGLTVWLVLLTGHTSSSGWAQQPTGTATAGSGPGEAAQEDANLIRDLATTYRLRQRFANPKRLAAGQISVGLQVYEVAVRRVEKDSTSVDDQVQTSASFEDRSRFFERAARTGSQGEINAVIRQYQRSESSYQVDERLQQTGPQFLQNAQVWYQLQPGELPEVILTNARDGLTVDEYRGIVEHPLLDQLTDLLPSETLHIGDSWQIALSQVPVLSQIAGVDSGLLQGRFLSLKRVNEPSANRQASLEITGRSSNGSSAEWVIRCLVQFRFRRNTAANANTNNSGPNQLVDAAGYISRVILRKNQRIVGTEEEFAGTVRYTEQLYDYACRPAEASQRLIVLQDRPESTIANSWLIFREQGQPFQFRFPQSYQFKYRSQEGAPEVDLSRLSSSQRDFIYLRPKLDEVLDPTAERQEAQIRNDLPEVILQQGAQQRLRTNDWAGNPTVDWFEFVARIQEPRSQLAQSRITIDGYVLNYPEGNGLVAQSNTIDDPPLKFRQEVREILSTFEFLPTLQVDRSLREIQAGGDASGASDR